MFEKSLNNLSIWSLIFEKNVDPLKINILKDFSKSKQL